MLWVQAYEIPEEYRQTVMDEAWNCVLRERELVAAANASAIDEMKANNCEIYTLDHDALVEAVAPIYEKFSDTLPTDLIKATQDLLAE